MELNSRAFLMLSSVFLLASSEPAVSLDENKKKADQTGSVFSPKVEKDRRSFVKTSSPLDSSVTKKQLEKFPLWRKNKKYRRAMLSEEKIWVVAKTRDSNHPKMKEELSIAGAGMTSANKDHAFTVLNDFPGWETLDEYVKKVSYDSEKKELYVHLAAYGYFAKMFFQVEANETESHSDLYMKVIRGHFLGMTVGFRIQKDAKSRKSEILMTAVHPFETLPLPRSFIEFGLEIVFQRLGVKLRQKMQSNMLAGAEST